MPHRSVRDELSDADADDAPARGGLRSRSSSRTRGGSDLSASNVTAEAAGDAGGAAPSVWRDPRVAAAVAFAASPCGSAFPVLAAMAAVPVLYTCVSMAKSYGHIPEWLDTPPISLAGIHEPEATVYRTGFPLITAALFFLEIPVIILIRAGLQSATIPETATAATADASTITADDRADLAAAAADNAAAIQDRETALSTLERASMVARIAFAGLALQGIIPLQGMGDLAGLVHVMGANVFFLLSIYHGACVLWCTATLTADAAGPTSLPVSRSADTVGWWFRGFVLVAAFFPTLPAMLLHPGTGPVDTAAVMADSVHVQEAMASGGDVAAAQQQAINQANHMRNMESAGFAQWWMVGAIVFYYALYSRDLWMMGRANLHRISPRMQAAGLSAVPTMLGFAAPAATAAATA